MQDQPTDRSDDSPAGPPPGGITLFWRPACGFCAVLRRDLASSGLPIVEVDIWEDPAAAAVVRSVAKGNETVPTVVIGAIDDPDRVGLVNPSAAQVVDAVSRHAPHLLPDGGR